MLQRCQKNQPRVNTTRIGDVVVVGAIVVGFCTPIRDSNRIANSDQFGGQFN